MKDAALDGNEFQEKPLAQTTAVDPAPSATTNPETTRRRGTDWWGEVKGIFWLILVVLGFHSFIAKPFYIPSESMLPGLRIGDRLVVTKFAYGWSFVSPTIPNPVAIFKGVVLRQQEDSWSVSLPFIHGRLFGSLPTRGDAAGHAQRLYQARHRPAWRQTRRARWHRVPQRRRGEARSLARHADPGRYQ
jgi:signal peptidase I